MIGTFCSEQEWDLAVAIDSTATVAPGLPISGETFETVSLRQGRIDVAQLRGYGHELLTALLSTMQCFGPVEPLLQFMQKLVVAGRSGYWLLKHMIWHLGGIVEESFLLNRAPPPPAAPSPNGESAGRNDESIVSRHHHEKHRRRL